MLGRRQVKVQSTAKVFHDKRTSTGPQYWFQAEDDEALWLVGGTTPRCLAVWDTERMQVEELLRDTVGLVREIWQGSAKQIDICGAQHIMGAMED